MTDFKVGDRVRLTGPEWGYAFPLPDMNTVTVEYVGKDGILKFVGIEGWWYGDEDEGWGMELNPDTPTEHFAKTAAKFANDPLSTEDIEQLKTLGEQLGISSFEKNVRRILEGVADIAVQKNLAYGDSALNPIRVFSKADRMEQLYTRLDDKLSRVQKGHEYPGDDTIRDIIGYCTLILIAREGE